MKFSRCHILPDIVIIEPLVCGDDRGYFMETYRHDKLEQFLGHKVHFVQDNESRSAMGVLRGLHYQLPPAAQAKLVRVIQGKVLDVVVDIRRNSPAFGQHVSLELSADNRKQLFIPQGFAHGFVTLENDTVYSYKVDNYYSPEHEKGLAFDDPVLAINWQIADAALHLSAKDSSLPPLAMAEIFDSNPL